MINKQPATAKEIGIDMKHFVLVLCLMCMSVTSQALGLINDEHISDQKDCFSGTKESYESWRAGMKRKHEMRQLSGEEVEQALNRFDAMFGKAKYDAYKKSLSCVTFSYLVDGNRVLGYAIKPKHSKKNLPVLIYNRGGNGNFGAVVFGKMMLSLFPVASEGFIVVGSQYRGTFTKGVSSGDEFGGADIKDVTELLRYIPSIQGADPNRIGMYGSSRGGMQTFLALKELNNIKAVASIAGPTDLIKGLASRPKMENVHKKRIPDYEENKVEALEKRSVIKWVNELPKNVPILLLHGTSDKRVSVDHSIALAEELKEKGIHHKLVLYPNDDHGLSKNREKARAELVNWFLAHL